MILSASRRYRLFLFGHINHAEAAFADFFQQLVAADDCAGAFGQGDGKQRRRCYVHSRLLHEAARTKVLRQQIFNASS